MKRAGALRQPTSPARYLILPSASVLLMLSIVPLLLLVVFSFVKGNISPGSGIESFTSGNFITMFSSPLFSTLMLKSLRIALLVTFVCVLIAYPAAWAIAKIVPPKYRNMLIMVAIVPAFTSQLLLIHSIMLLFQSNGVVMKALESIGITSAKGSILYSTPAVILILIYEYLPYMMLCLYSCLEKIDDNVIEASHSLGAGRVRTFLNVVLPQSLSGLFVGFLIVFIPVAGSFVEPKVAGGPYGMMVGSLIDAQFTTVLNMGYGAALSLVFLLVMAAILAVVNFVFRRTEKVIGG